MRGVAILAVLAHQLCIDGYSGPLLPGSGRGVAFSLPLPLALAPLQSGWWGVQLFFVLSGFLITGILLDTRRAENYWSSFFARRALRIFPVYYLLLVATFVVVPLVLGTTLPAATVEQYRHQGWYWAYLANVGPLVGESAVTTLGHCWSLSVEEQFYFVWPFAVRLLDERGLARLCVGLVVAAFVLRLALCLAGANPELAYELTPARADALALGALGAIVVRDDSWILRVRPRLGTAIGAMLGVLAVTAIASGGLARTNPVTQTVGYTAIAVVSALVIVQAIVETQRGRGRLASLLSSRVLRVYGRYSYAIYVFHLPLHLAFTHAFIEPRLAGLSPSAFLALQAAYVVAGALALLLIGALSYRMLERPLLDLKRFFVAREVTRAAV